MPGEPRPMPMNEYCAEVANWNPTWAALEEDILRIVNERRAAGASCGGQQFQPAPPIEMERALQCAARKHSLDMAERDYFSHDSPEGDGPGERLDEAGYDGRGWGENIAAGSDDAEGAMRQWMGSPGHCRNIMNDDYGAIGVGYAPGGEYDHIWTQTFGG